MKNNRQLGFSLVEIMVAAAVTSIVTFGVSTVFINMKKAENSLADKMENSTDTLAGENAMVVDLRNMDPSYNNLKLLDDSGKLFFEHFSDVPLKFLDKNSSRKLTLSVDSGKNEFYFLQAHTSFGPVLLYEPMLAYDVGNMPSDFNVSASLTFQSLNFGQAVSSKRKSFWLPGQVLFLDTPARVRPNINGQIDMMIPSRSSAYLGVVNGQQLNQSKFNQIFDFTNPETGNIAQSVDQFLKEIPSMGGGQNYVRIRAVNLVRYTLVPMAKSKNKGAAQLLRTNYGAELSGNSVSSSFLIADNVKSVEFERTSVCDKVLKFSITKFRED